MIEIYPNATIFVQVALFVCFWFAFKGLVVGPMTDVLAERQRRTTDAEHNAEQLAAAAAADRAQYDQRVFEQRQRMAQEAEQARHAAIAASNEEIAAARLRIAQELAHRREAVVRQVAQARQALAGEAEQIALEMLTRVRSGGPNA